MGCEGSCVSVRTPVCQLSFLAVLSANSKLHQTNTSFAIPPLTQTEVVEIGDQVLTRHSMPSYHFTFLLLERTDMLHAKVTLWVMTMGIATADGQVPF